MRSRPSILSQPLLIGAIGLLVVVAGVYLSYSAGAGLPFVPRYRVYVQLPNSDQVLKGADVTIAGDRVGQVSAVRAAPRAGEPPIAVLELAIDKSYEPIPADTTATVQITGSLGRKFLALTPGRSARPLADGGTLPLSQAQPATVDIDQLLNTFRAPVRAGIRESLQTLGYGFAGRGAGINQALGEFPGLLTNLRPVMGELARPSTGLARLTRAVARFSGELAPVSEQTAGLFEGLDTTFAALARVAPDLEQTISATPPALATVTAAIPQTAPLLRQGAALLHDLRPAVAYLPRASAPLASAFAAGARNLPGVPGLDRRLVDALGTVADFSGRTDVHAGLQRMVLTFQTLDPLVAFITPSQTVCNYPALFVRNLSSLFKEHIATGTTLRVGGVVVGVDKNSERGPSTGIYTGKIAKALGPLHSNPLPNTASPGEPRECEAGREPYVQNEPILGNVPGNQGVKTESAKLP
jgi:virulence factor Mce-like protein